MSGSLCKSSELSWDDLRVAIGFRRILRLHQGVCLQVFDGAAERELLRFDCYDEVAHYHYRPNESDQRYWLDPALRCEPVPWALELLRQRLPAMVKKAGLARAVAPFPDSKIAELGSAAAQADRTLRDTLMHEPGAHLVSLGGLVFGVKYDIEAAGISLRVLRSTRDGLEEMVGFDCHRDDPHYHYGPRRMNAVIGIDLAATPRPLEWACDLIRSGGLAPLLARAGYAESAAEAASMPVRRGFARRVEPLVALLDRAYAAGGGAAQ
jgi:hypothetical protein